MKKIICFLIAVVCYGIGFSQNFNYQAVVRDAAGDPVVNQSVGVLVRIIEGSPSGSVVYNEVHTVTSNDQGVITFLVGGGTSGANFQAINWSTQNQWIDVQVDITGGTTYTQIGTSKLQFVPYAMYALNSNNATNAGPFDYTNNVISNSNGDITTDDFVFGSSQLDNNGSFNAAFGNRMFFDKSKAAFRAGYTSQTQWDEANVGTYSTAFGEGGRASGTNSFAVGRNANATGNESFAFGTNAGGFGDFSRGFGINARANGVNSTAIGRQLNANSMAEIQLGQYSNFVSGSLDTWVPTDRLFVIGNGQEDINLALNSDALVMLKNGNTTLNGTLTIDGDNQGAGTAFTLPAQDGTVNQIMQTDGSGNVTWVTPAADAIPNGGNNGEVLSTDGSGVLSWISNDILPAGGTNGFVLSTDGSGNYSWVTTDDADASATNEIELPVGGNNGQVLATDGSGVYSWIDQPALPVTVFSTVSNVTSNAPGDIATDDFVFGSTQLDNIAGADDNSRMFYDKSRGAFRAGNMVDGIGGFDEANLGLFSVGFGQVNRATGWYSATMGLNNTSSGLGSLTAGDTNVASGSQSVALGSRNTASGNNSIALGIGNTASGSGSVTLGGNLTAESAGQISLGYLNTAAAGDPNVIIDTDRLFVIGNGEFDMNGPVNSDALVMLKNGNTAFSGNVGIGTTTPETTYALNVNGDLNYTGNLTNISDRRYKKNIQPLNNSLEKIVQTEGVQYEMRKDEFAEINFADGTQYGVIAQEIEKIFPNLVTTNKEGFKSVNYTGLIPVLVEAIKEQQKLIEKQETEISELKAETSGMSSLEKRLQALEAVMKSQVTYNKN
ncbi:tail fiber domain-containing protein [Aquimarina sp. MMG016]|uniref:tail fiber domain-containing protein n=1 Tax=Aquimarina sp. MMG016 TaxID=2822690 RepID=UPI001B3A24D3|nr:tail fiber domain-containing protein [Aquimarina sp. MMG016]MBQ4820605.1 tail fiber domain-containing protein [Aquimarina sp. MMG016]